MSLLGIETIVRDRLGMDPNSLGPSALPQAIETRLRIRGIKTPEEYVGLLARDTSEAASLGAELAVPESWFFRGGRGLFSRMAEFVASRAATHAGHPVRVLSIPCSTGEEPYSLAIAFHEHFIPPKEYRIDAVDVSTRHLERAEAAQFSSFSFREVGSDIRPAYFRQLGDRWELLPHLRQLVRFRIANLTDPAFLIEEPPYDLIVCRNVFIYLTSDGRRRAMASLDRLLAIHGMMCLTAGEADRLPPGQFALATSGEFSLYRRVCADDVAPKVWTPAQPKPIPHSMVSVPRPAQFVTMPPSEPIVAPVVVQPRIPLLKAARALADAGRLSEARAACDEMLREAGVSADAYTLLGTIHLAEGHGEEAAEAFRRALYLDPDHQEAISHMIVMSDRKGNATQSMALRRRLARLSREGAK